MKRSKIFRNILSVALAASMMFGCFAFAGCNDSKSDKKDKKKVEKEEDEDEEEETTTTEAEETEAEETEAEETEAEESEDEDEIDPDFDMEIETVDASAFEDDYMKELAEKYMDKGLAIVKMSDEDMFDVEGLVEGFMADSTEDSMQISVSTEDEDANSASGKMEMAIVIKFDTAENAQKFFEQFTSEFDPSELEDGIEYIDNDKETTLSQTDVGSEVLISFNKEKNVIEYYMMYDLDALMAAFNAEDDAPEI